MPQLKIGEVARKAGCQVDTIRYYESQGLLRRPERSEGNFRLYAEVDVERARFIRYCRSLDMTLAEVRELLELRDHPEEDCGEVVALLDKHVARVGRRIAELRSLERHLVELRGCCGPGRAAGECGILQELAVEAEERVSAGPPPVEATQTR